ncbi:MAG: GntR family transcriptional regulator [Pseudomonas sp.]|uniref:FadR/GntR family transcriptional regulator n=1 Tax=Pseudomonas sp. TaxID=306 RepID=UPI003394524E
MTESTRTPPRPHAADAALQGLFIEIFNGSLAPGDSLPPERVLAERYGVSRIIVRQAVHKLKDVGLVEVRQGGASRVLDPALADARVLELLLRYGAQLRDGAAQLQQELQEYQALYAIGLLEAAARRATQAERQALLQLVQACPADPDEVRARTLDDAFWRHITRMGKNRILQMEMALWRRWQRSHEAAEDPAIGDPAAGDPADDTPLGASPAELRWFYHALAKQLATGKDPLPFYLATVRGN